MLSHLNYLFPQYPTQAKMMANDMPSANQQNHIEQEAEEEATTVLQSPKLKGPADHVAFVIHGIGQVNTNTKKSRFLSSMTNLKFIT